MLCILAAYTAGERFFMSGLVIDCYNAHALLMSCSVKLTAVPTVTAY